MKRLKPVLLILSILLLFAACKKKDVKATLIINVNCRQPITDIHVYVKSGTLSDPQIPLTSYDQQLTADSLGLLVLSDLDEGDYFLYATATSGTTTVKGSVSASVFTRPMPNRYEKALWIE